MPKPDLDTLVEFDHANCTSILHKGDHLHQLFTCFWQLECLLLNIGKLFAYAADKHKQLEDHAYPNTNY